MWSVWGVARALPLPGADEGEVLVVALGLALVGLVLDPEVAAAGLLAHEGVAAHELGQLEEVGDPQHLLERLVDARRRSPSTRTSFPNSSRSAGISVRAFSRPALSRAMPQ